MTSAIDLHINLSGRVSKEALRRATDRAHAAAVLALQQSGEISIREAASELSLTYEGILAVLSANGLPATGNTADRATLAWVQALTPALGAAAGR
ncbi:MAG: hypothetical protein NT029_14305 [Armatimonadetes bacterium]|nr:hypothetical protein [Armatimonadota bacterium]